MSDVNLFVMMLCIPVMTELVVKSQWAAVVVMVMIAMVLATDVVFFRLFGL